MLPLDERALVFGVLDAVEGELDRVGVHGRAVVEFDALFQLEGVFPGVCGDRPGLGKAGVDLGIAGLAVNQRVEDLAQHPSGGGQAGALRIQSVGVLPGAVDDLAAGLHGGSRLGADAPSGRQCEGQRNEDGYEAYGQATRHSVTPFLREIAQTIGRGHARFTKDPGEADQRLPVLASVTTRSPRLTPSRVNSVRTVLTKRSPVKPWRSRAGTDRRGRRQLPAITSIRIARIPGCEQEKSEERVPACHPAETERNRRRA